MAGAATRTLVRALVAAAALAAGAAPAEAATLVIAAERNPDSLDPALAYAPESWQVLVNCGEGLVTFRRAAGRAGAQVVPGLAAALPRVSAGGRRLVFTLRPDARFGPPASRPVRPSDVKASIERLFLVGSPGRGLYRAIEGADAFERSRAGGIAGIVARDASRTLEIRLVRSEPAILQALALPFAFVLPRETPATADGGVPAASAGPYRIARYVPDAVIELERNPVPAAGASGPERILVRIGMTPAQASRAIAAGSVHATQSRLGAAERRAARSAGARLRRHIEGTTYYLFMNTQRPPFDDVRVRQAVNLALDRAAMAAAFGGEAVPTAQVLPPSVPGYRRGAPTPGPDLPEARRLVAAAGARGAAVSVWGTTSEPSPTVARHAERALGAIGLRPQERLWERQDLLAALADPAAPSQIGYARWRQDFPDGADWYRLLLSGSAIRPGANLNYALLDDPEVDRLIARAAATWDPELRATRWSAVDRAVEARAPWAPFANSVRVDVVSPAVSGYVAHQLYGFLWMRARVP
jgi:peptide/nickel transport system substrate-binding protein